MRCWSPSKPIFHTDSESAVSLFLSVCMHCIGIWKTKNHFNWEKIFGNNLTLINNEHCKSLKTKEILNLLGNKNKQIFRIIFIFNLTLLIYCNKRNQTQDNQSG